MIATCWDLIGQTEVTTHFLSMLPIFTEGYRTLIFTIIPDEQCGINY